MRGFAVFVAMATFMPAGLVAQQPPRNPPQQPQPQQSRPPAARPGPDLNGLLGAAGNVVAMIDQNRAANVWDGLSPRIRERIARDAFANSVIVQRRQLGAVANRNWLGMSIGAIAADSKQAPAGQYISVSFGARFADGALRVETVSFRLDEDGLWRPSGYLIVKP